MLAIDIKELTKVFAERTAVDHLNLQIREGEIFALLGANGAGKTTTIRMLCGLIPPTSGDGVLAGKSIVLEPELAKKKINVSPQETAVAPLLTVQENLEMIARIYGMDRKKAKIQAKEMMEKFQLSDRARENAKKLSGGYQRRLSIAMALITQPEILFLDEPTLGLDVRARRNLWKLIQELKGNMTIVLTTHYLEEAEALADRIGIMNQGRLEIIGTVEQIEEQTGEKSLEEAFLELTEEDQCEA